MTSVSDEQILDYVDGDADEITIKAVEQAIKEDPEIRKTAELIRLSKDLVQEGLQNSIEPPADFIAKLGAMEEAQQNETEGNVITRYFGWRPIAKAANSNQFKMLVAACFALVFVVSQDVVQIAEQPWEGKVSTNSFEKNSAPKTRSLVRNDILVKKIIFTSTRHKAVKLEVGIYEGPKTKNKSQPADENDFVIYQNWFKTLSGYFGIKPGDVLNVEIGQRIQLSVNAIEPGQLSLELVQDRGPAFSFFKNVKMSKNQVLKTNKLAAEPPADLGEFILSFTTTAKEKVKLVIPFELIEANE